MTRRKARRVGRTRRPTKHGTSVLFAPIRWLEDLLSPRGHPRRRSDKHLATILVPWARRKYTPGVTVTKVRRKKR